jgi:hypothetical protein
MTGDDSGFVKRLQIPFHNVHNSNIYCREVALSVTSSRCLNNWRQDILYRAWSSVQCHSRLALLASDLRQCRLKRPYSLSCPLQAYCALLAIVSSRLVSYSNSFFLGAAPCPLTVALSDSLLQSVFDVAKDVFCGICLVVKCKLVRHGDNNTCGFLGIGTCFRCLSTGHRRKDWCNKVNLKDRCFGC